jgi:exosortase/archaeosortase family protein
MHEEIIEPPYEQPRRPPGIVAFIVIFGVLLPIVALGMELGTEVLKGSFFDPLPTLFHAALIAMVPLANAMLAMTLMSERVFFPRVFPWLQAFAMGISMLYAILFLPVTPIGAIGIVFYGIGLLPLAPLLSLIAGAYGRRQFKRMSGAPLPHLWRGMALAAAALIAFDVPASITRAGLQIAVVREGAMLAWDGRLISIDAPCSGVKMLWAGLYLAAALAASYRLPAGRTLAALLLGCAVVVAANAVRAASLFQIEAGLLPLAPWAHQGIGVVCFIAAATGILYGVRALQGGVR